MKLTKGWPVLYLEIVLVSLWLSLDLSFGAGLHIPDNGGGAPVIDWDKVSGAGNRLPYTWRWW